MQCTHRGIFWRDFGDFEFGCDFEGFLLHSFSSFESAHFLDDLEKCICVCVRVCVQCHMARRICHVVICMSYTSICVGCHTSADFVVWEMCANERGKEWERGEVERVNMHARASKRTSEFVSEREVALGGGRTGKREREGERKRARKCV